MNDLQKYLNEIIDEQIPIEKFVAAGITEKLVKNTYNVRCPKCGSDNVNEQEMQTRSADEASCKKYLCLNCSNRWQKG